MSDGLALRARRRAPLLVGGVDAGVRPLPRRGVGPAGPRRRRAVRAAVPGGVPVGASWLTILRKREAFRSAFAGFEIDAVAAFGPGDVERLMGDAGIVRNRAKIDAALANARAAAALRRTASRWPPSSGDSHPRAAAGAPDARRRPRGDIRVDGARPRPQAARLPLRRADHRVRADAGVRARRRPPGGMLRPRRRALTDLLCYPPCPSRPCSTASDRARRRRRPPSC